MYKEPAATYVPSIKMTEKKQLVPSYTGTLYTQLER